MATRKKTTTSIAITVPNELLELIDQKAHNLQIARSALISTVMDMNIREEGLECLRVEKLLRMPK